MHKYFPLFVDLTDKTVVIIGGGKIAQRRCAGLLDFPANLIVVAPEVTKQIEEWEIQKRVFWKKKSYETMDIQKAFFVLAVTDDVELNHRIVLECQRHSIWCNNASKKEESDFYFPGLATKDEVVIGISASGENHQKTKRLGEGIRVLLEEEEGNDR